MNPETDNPQVVDEGGNGGKKWIYGWIPIVVVAVIFIGARMLHPEGVRGIISDATAEVTSNQEQGDRQEMMRYLTTLGAAAMCIKNHGDNEMLSNAVKDYNSRNSNAANELVQRIKESGGMSRAEKDLVDRQAYREAVKLYNDVRNSGRPHSELARRIESRMYDIKQ